MKILIDPATFDTKIFDKGYYIMWVLRNRNRRKIIALLLKEPNLSVVQIGKRLHRAPSMISQWLSPLRKTRVVLYRRKGQGMCYQINIPALYIYTSFADNLAKC